MSFLIPLGLLALISIAVLILIYLIRPNYQQKFISSTYVWKLSLRYKKKNVPVSKIRNLLIFLCQILILTCCALLVAQPVVQAIKGPDVTEKVVIIDASAGMRTEVNGLTRFENAVNQIKQLSSETAEDEGVISVIVADEEPYFLLQRANAVNLADIYQKLDGLVPEDGIKCSYGNADIDGAVELADEVLYANPDAQVLFYTGTEYLDKSGIEVVDVSQNGEWNVAVSNCRAELNAGFYDFSADVGCYGRSEQITVHCQIAGCKVDSQGAAETRTVEMSKTVLFDASAQEQTVVFGENDQLAAASMRVFSFESVYIYVEEADSFADDNYYYLYGGQKPVIKIQYASSLPNIFLGNAFLSLREKVASRWDVEYTEVREGAEYATEGFDLYVFEHSMPDVMPTDGVVLLVDPDKAPQNSGLMLGDYATVNSDSTLASGTPHPVTNGMTPDNITVAGYRRILAADGYEELMYYAGDPVLLVKNEPSFKAAVLAINVHRSNFVMLMDFPIFISNLFNYFFPSTFSGYTFSVGDEVTLNSRGEDLLLTASSGNLSEHYEAFPASFIIPRPGVYTLQQTSLRGDPLTEFFFAGIPVEQSKIDRMETVLTAANRVTREEMENMDLLLYFAIALISILVLEWLLQSREYLR